MSDARCEGNCDLVSISFADNTWICNSIFKGNVNFSNTEVKNNLDISGTLFASGKPNLEGLKISAPEKLITAGTKLINFNAQETK
jgi:hypothetical protein